VLWIRHDIVEHACAPCVRARHGHGSRAQGARARGAGRSSFDHDTPNSHARMHVQKS